MYDAPSKTAAEQDSDESDEEYVANYDEPEDEADWMEFFGKTN